MIIEERKKRKNIPEEEMIIRLTDSMVYDRLHTLSLEYSVSVELLVTIAVKRLIDDVELVRYLRAGKIDSEYMP